jgi:hypothetical protein
MHYAAKCMAALAVQGDSPLGDTWWNDWYTNQHLQRVAPYYTANLGGGGWTEGFAQYGILGTENQALPALAVKTAKGIDLSEAQLRVEPLGRLQRVSLARGDLCGLGHFPNVGPQEGDRLDILVALIEAWEPRHYPGI